MWADETKHYGADDAVAAEFLQGVAQRLGLDESFIFPAFEISFIIFGANVSYRLMLTLDARLNDPMGVSVWLKCLVRFKSSHWSCVTCWIWNEKAETWQTGEWFCVANTVI